MLLNEFLAAKEQIYLFLAIMLFMSLLGYKFLSKLKQRFFVIVFLNLAVVMVTFSYLKISELGPVKQDQLDEISNTISAYKNNSNQYDKVIPGASHQIDALEIALTSDQLMTYQMLDKMNYLQFRSEFAYVTYKNIIDSRRNDSNL